MVKKTIDDDVNFDDINFDSDLDIGGDGDFNLGQKTGKRAVVEEATTTFLKDLKTGVTDSSYIRKLVGLVMPKGYSQAFNAYDATLESINNIYKDNEAELRPYMAAASRKLKQNKSRLKNVLPKSLQRAMDESETMERSETKRSEDAELSGNLSSLDKLFQMQASDQVDKKINDAKRDLKEDRKFALGLRSQANITDGIGRLVSYQDKILINYHRKSLEIGFRQYDVQKRLFQNSQAFYKDAITTLTNIQKNTALPDFIKMKGPEVIKDRLRQRLADATISGLTRFRGDYFKRITDTTSGAIQGLLQIGQSLNTMQGIASKEQMAGMAIGSAAAGFIKPKVQYLGEHLADMTAPAVNRIPGLKNTGDKLRMFLTDPQGALNRFRMSEDTDTGIKGWIKGSIKNMLPGFTPKDKIQGMGIEGLGDVASFDNLFYTSVTQIMPAYLESMDRSLASLVTGNEEEGQAWSHYTGGMVSRSTLDQQHVRLGIFRGQGNNIRREISDLISKIGGDVLSPEAKGALSKRLLIDMQKGQGFEPSDYVKPDSWPDQDEEVADELIEFFSDTFQLDNEGKFLGNDKGFLADIKEAFTDASNRMPAALERAQVLSDRVMGRDVLRRLGITQYTGAEDDEVNQEAWAQLALGEEPLEVTKWKAKEKPEYRKMGIKEGYKAMREESRNKLKEMEEQQRLEREALAREGKYDVIDTVQRSLTKRGVKPLTKPSSAEWTGGVSGQPSTTPVNQIPTEFVLFDEGTHDRLDAILQRMDSLGTFREKPEQPAMTNPEWMGTIADKAKEGYQKAIDKGNDLIAKTKRWYKEDPKVRKVVDRIEKEYGKITDPALRAKLIQAIYNKTGTPEEVYAYFSKRIMEIKGKAKEMSDRSTAYLQEIWGNREQYKETVTDWSKEKYQATSDYLKGHYDKRDEYKEEISGRFQRAKERMKVAGSNVSDWLKERASLSDISDTGTHDRLDITNQLLQSLLENGIPSGDGVVTPRKQGLFGKAGRMALGGVKGLTKGVWKYTTASYKALWKGGTMAVKAAGAVTNATFNEEKYGVRDVHLLGEEKPRLRATDIRSGLYVDKNTQKVIKRLKDITGPVIEVTTGNEVISQEEFDSGNLVDGKGDSLAMYLGRKAGSAALSIGKGIGMYLTGSYGLMYTVGKTAFKLGKDILEDQFTQFDAYFPGEEEPRIRSKLMKKGFYRDEEGKPILSLKDIKGPVFDDKGNEIISKDEMEQFKSLYTRNGSLLFTFGRGMASATKWAAKMAGNYLVGSYKLMGKVAMAGLRGIKGLGKGILNKFMGGKQGGMGGGSEWTDTLLAEQLRIQQDMYDLLKKRLGKGGDKEEDYADSDNDGVRDNSWLDIISKRKSRKARGPNADVVNAINGLGDRLEDNLDDIRDAVEDENGSGGGKGFWDKIKGFGKKAGGMFGLGSLFGGDETPDMGNKKGRKPSLLKRVLKGAVTGGGKMLWGAAKFAVKRIAVPVLIGAAKVAGAVVSSIGLPLLLTGAAIGAVAYMGWKYYSNKKFKEKPLFYLRMTQYGVSPTDGDLVEPILQLETLLAVAVKDLDGNNPDFTPNKVDIRRIYELFGLLQPTPEGEEPTQDEEIDPERKDKLIKWLAYRFKPTYLKHMAALNAIAKTKDLNKVDELIRTKGEMNDFLNRVTNRDFSRIYDNTSELTPFDDDLDKDADDVVDMFKKCRNLAETLPEKPKTDKTTGDVNTQDVDAIKTPGPIARNHPNRKKTDKTVNTTPAVTTPGKSASEMTPEEFKKADLERQEKVFLEAQAKARKNATIPDDVVDVVSRYHAPQKNKAAVTTEPEPDLRTSVDVSREMALSSERERIASMQESNALSSSLLNKAVDKLTSIDETLKDIKDSVNRQGAQNKGKVVPAIQKTVPGFELPNMTGRDMADQMKPSTTSDGQFDSMKRRPNVSSRRKYAAV